MTITLSGGALKPTNSSWAAFVNLGIAQNGKAMQFVEASCGNLHPQYKLPLT